MYTYIPSLLLKIFIYLAPLGLSCGTQDLQALVEASGDFPSGSEGKSVCLQCGRPGFDSWVRKIPWRRIYNPVQYPCLENPMYGEAGRLQSRGLQRITHD